MTSERHCPKCRLPLSERATECPVCGAASDPVDIAEAATTTPHHCEQCSFPLPPKAAECPVCHAATQPARNPAKQTKPRSAYRWLWSIVVVVFFAAVLLMIIMRLKPPGEGGLRLVDPERESPTAPGSQPFRESTDSRSRDGPDPSPPKVTGNR